MVLNACQSATLDEKTEDAFATVATALLRGGMRCVVAMAYSLYVSGAQVFLPAFYGRLFETGSMAEATLAARQQLLANSERMSARGLFSLEDWLVPVLYQQMPLDLGFAKHSQSEVFESRLPEEIREHRELYGFIGRDGPILEMERALQRETPCILIQGLGGVGKTTLARGFLRWLDETGGLDGALWFDFRDIRSAAHVINRTGEVFYGANFAIAPNQLELIARALEKVRVLMVWDSFDSAAQNLANPDRDELRRFLEAIRGTRGKVIMTSRSWEEWIEPQRRFVVRLGGLDREERWEYCEKILNELGLASRMSRDDPAFSNLMQQLGGHPLAMRAVLPRLEHMSVAEIAKALKNNFSELGLNDNEGYGRLFATLHFVERGLPQELHPLLALVGLHELHMDADWMEAMAEQLDPVWTRARIDQLMAVLAAAGLVRGIGDATYEIHPLLTSYLRSQADAPETYQRAFVDVMGKIADALATRELHQQRVPFLLHGANFHRALDLSARLRMDQHFAALTQSLAAFAQNTRDFVEASRLLQQLAQHSAAVGNSNGEAAAYHQLGLIAQEKRNFVEAREWYLKSLDIEGREGNEPGAASTYHQLGSIAYLQREFLAAREWYLRSLAISERQGNERFAAGTYHQLGIITEEQGDYAVAREWYLKSLAISERQGNETFTAGSYHQLGMIAQEQGDFARAREWYLKSLAIKERQGNEQGAASTYHQLGMIAQEQGDFARAREWYLKSLAISERLDDSPAAANTYHQLGRTAQEQRDFVSAREWYLKSLSISEMSGDLYGAAVTYGQLGILEGLIGDLDAAARWLTRSVAFFSRSDKKHEADRGIRNFLVLHKYASAPDKQKLERIWREAGVGAFPSSA